MEVGSSHFGELMSYVREPRHSEEEYKKYAPNEYRRLGTVINLFGFFGLTVLCIGVYLYINDGNVSSLFIWLLLFFLSLCFVGTIVIPFMWIKLDDLVANRILKERDALQTKVAEMQNDIKSVGNMINELKAKGLRSQSETS